MKLQFPEGPIRPVLEALDDNEILRGFVASLEESALLQLERLEKADSWQEYEGRLIHTIHGLNGETWHLESLFSDYFPGLQRSAAFLAIWATFEHHLNELCREVSVKLNLGRSVADLQGAGARRARTYLTQEAGLAGDWADKFWEELTHLQKMRNLFAHGDGTVATEPSAQRSYAEKSPHVEIHGDRVRLGAGFLPHVLEAQYDFLQSLRKTLEAHFGKWEPVIFDEED